MVTLARSGPFAIAGMVVAGAIVACIPDKRELRVGPGEAGAPSPPPTGTSDTDPTPTPTPTPTGTTPPEPEPEPPPGPACYQQLNGTKSTIDAEQGQRFNKGVSLPYRGPKAATTTACTSADIAQLDANFASGATTFDGWTKSVSAPCTACAFSKTTDATWAPLVHDGSGGLFVNFGACIASVGGDACGSAFYYVDTCARLNCPNCPDAADDDACIKKAVADPQGCAALEATMSSACTSAAINACGSTLFDHIKKLCGPP